MKIFLLLGAIFIGIVNFQACKISVKALQKADVRFGCRQEMKQIADALEREYAASEQLPTGSFPDFLRENLRRGASTRDVTLDVWGSPYRLLTGAGRFVVVSNGPDRKRDNADDIRIGRDVGPRRPSTGPAPKPGTATSTSGSRSGGSSYRPTPKPAPPPARPPPKSSPWRLH